MTEELLINVSPMESRVALMNSGVLSEIYIERHNKLGLVGNIYVGTVVRILPGMQAAFIDIGQSRTAFLHVNDMQKLGKKTAYSASSPTVTANIKDTQANNQGIDNQGIDNQGTEKQSLDNQSVDNQATVGTQTGVTETSGLRDAQTAKGQSEQLTNGQATAAQKLAHRLHDPLVNTTPPYSLFAQAKNITGLNDSDTATSTEEKTEKPKTNDFITNNGMTQPIKLQESNVSMSNLQTAKVNSSILSDTSTKSDITIPDISHIKTLSTISGLPNKTHVGYSLNTTNMAASNMPNMSRGNMNHSSQAKQDRKDQRQDVNSDELIQNRLHEGQRILVQVTKDQLGTKGARLTTNISLPSRYLVYLPSGDHIGISQRIDNTEERSRLKKELGELMQTVNLSGGLIARTAAEHIQQPKLEEDIYYLLQLWRTIQARQGDAANKHTSLLVYQELSLPLRSIRDLVSDDTQRVVVDDPYMYEHLRQFSQEFVPMIFPRIVPHQSEQALFDIHRVEEDLQNALKRRVDLKSGGYLIIDQTEAMTTIDVNTGSFVGGRSLEDTVYKTNLEATHSIARQLRLRNLGGIIILDFIDMQEQEHKDDVLISLQTQLSQDYAKTNITQVSELGLVEMTRKRTRESLEQQLCETCPTCNGNGFIKTAETVCFDIFREIMRCARTYNAPKKFTVVAHAAVIDLLLTSEADTVADLEYLLGRVITFEVESRYTQEQYDIVLD